MCLKKPFFFSIVFIMVSSCLFVMLFLLSNVIHNSVKTVQVSKCIIEDVGKMEICLDSVSEQEKCTKVTGKLLKVPQYDYYNYGSDINDSGIYGRYYLALIDVHSDTVFVLPTEIEISEDRNSILFVSVFENAEFQSLSDEGFYIYSQNPLGDCLLYGPTTYEE